MPKIYQSHDHWGDATYATEEAMEGVIEKLQELGEDWKDVSIDDCHQWEHVSGDIYELRRVANPVNFFRRSHCARFASDGDGYYALVEYVSCQE